MKSLTKNIWPSSITHSVKIQLYNTYILPVLLYGLELWDVMWPVNFIGAGIVA